MPGFGDLAERIADVIELRGTRKRWPTPVDVKKHDPDADKPGAKAYRFGDRASGENYLKLDKRLIGGRDCVVLASGPGTWKMQGQLWYMLRYLAGRRARRIAVILGYFPLSRSDKDEDPYELALPPLMVDLMVTAAVGPEGRSLLNRIIAVDLHAPQVVMAGRTGLITEVSLVRRILMQAIIKAQESGQRVVLCLPDATAAKRTEKQLESAEDLLDVTLPQVIGLKRRETSRRSELRGTFGDTEALDGAVALTVDDEIATFGTNVDMAHELKGKFGAAKVQSLVSHGVLCGPAVERFLDPNCPVDHAYITDSIPDSIRGNGTLPKLRPLIDAGKLTVIPWLDDLSNVIFYHHWDESVRTKR
jgi:ribose-phosphate pyrophosphokinase